MSDKTMKIILSVLTVILLALIVGLVAMKGSSVKADLNKLALRIGELRQYRTMGRADVNAAMERHLPASVIMLCRLPKTTCIRIRQPMPV